MQPETKVWLSKPVKTLSVPYLSPNDDDGFRPASVLLLLAGTGIVVAPQVLHHREPIRKLGISTPRSKQFSCPIDLIHSCREDDILLLPQIRDYCLEGLRPHPRFRGLRNYTLLLTDHKTGNVTPSSSPPYQGDFSTDMENDTAKILKDLPNNATVKFQQRLDEQLVADAIGRLKEPYRVIVSGPDSYNNAAREYLEISGVDSTWVTILSA